MCFDNSNNINYDGHHKLLVEELNSEIGEEMSQQFSEYSNQIHKTSLKAEYKTNDCENDVTKLSICGDQIKRSNDTYPTAQFDVKEISINTEKIGFRLEQFNESEIWYSGNLNEKNTASPFLDKTLTMQNNLEQSNYNRNTFVKNFSENIVSFDANDLVSESLVYLQTLHTTNDESMPYLTAISKYLPLDAKIIQRIDHSVKFIDEIYEFRFVILPRSHPYLNIEKLKKNNLLSESEWRNLGIRQTRGWEHFGNSRYEPNVLLFKRPSIKSQYKNSHYYKSQKAVFNRLYQIKLWQKELYILTQKFNTEIKFRVLYGSTFPIMESPSGDENQILHRPPHNVSPFQSYNEHSHDLSFNVLIHSVSRFMEAQDLESQTNLVFFDLCDIGSKNFSSATIKSNHNCEKTLFINNVDLLYTNMHLPLILS